MKKANSKANRNRLHRYRERHPRVDYYPMEDVWEIVQRQRAATGRCLAGILDDLIRAGHAHVSGNAPKKLQFE